MQRTVGVIGGGLAKPHIARIAEDVGAGVALLGARLICGGLGGVMEAACRGAKRAGGTTIGILPSSDINDANLYVDIPIATGIGEARNLIIVRSADALIAVDGRFGTLTEVAFALQLGKPVVGIGTWEMVHPSGCKDPIHRVGTAAAAVKLAAKLMERPIATS